MKKFIFLLGLVALSLFASAQINLAPSPSLKSLEVWGSLFNTSNVYRNVPTAQTLGLQVDTSSTTFYQTTATLSTGVANADTFIPKGLDGTGFLSFTAYVWHASSTSTVSAVTTCTLEKAINENTPQTAYTPVVGATVFTLTATAAANKIAGGVPVTCNWNVTAKDGRLYHVKFAPSADTIAAQTGFWFGKTQEYSLSPR